MAILPRILRGLKRQGASSWAGRGKDPRPAVHPDFKGKPFPFDEFEQPIAPLSEEELYRAQVRSVFPQAWKTQAELATEHFDPKLRGGRLPRMSEGEALDQMRPLDAPGGTGEGAPPLPKFPVLKKGEKHRFTQRGGPTLRERQRLLSWDKVPSSTAPVEERRSFIRHLKKDLDVELPFRTGEIDPLGAFLRAQKLGPQELEQFFPASGKFLTDDPAFRQNALKASGFWLRNHALPAAARQNIQAIMGKGRFGTEGTIAKAMGTIYDNAFPLEQRVARYDMMQALERNHVSEKAFSKLKNNKRAMNAVHGTYVQANRIRAMQEMLEQYGHGGQRRLHDISGMLFARSQRLAEAMERGGTHAFNAEITQWSGLEKFLKKFGAKAFYVNAQLETAKQAPRYFAKGGQR
jgi:hypothetical protein